MLWAGSCCGVMHMPACCANARRRSANTRYSAEPCRGVCWLLALVHSPCQGKPRPLSLRSFGGTAQPASRAPLLRNAVGAPTKRWLAAGAHELKMACI